VPVTAGLNGATLRALEISVEDDPLAEVDPELRLLADRWPGEGASNEDARSCIEELSAPAWWNIAFVVWKR
jgi:hypothetical protein